MRKASGYVTIVGDFERASADGGMIERDTASCGHCQQVILTKPGSVATVYLIPQMNGPDKEEPGAMCRVCMRPVCLHCHADGNCKVWERRIEEIEAKGRRDAMWKAAGL